MTTFSGLTWDHPRGYQALEAASTANGGPIQWTRQPLSGFEEAPIAELCSRYDVIVLDHPHLGEALASNCLQPLDTLFPPEKIAEWRTQSVGKSFDSYLMNGRLWALPLDAATQVMAHHSDFCDEPLKTWEHLRHLSRETGCVALSLQGPHAALTVFSIYFSMGYSLGEDTLLCGGAIAAIDLMAEIYATVPTGSESLNPIAMLESIQNAGPISVCPLIYGYVNYAQGAPSNALHFCDVPLWRAGGQYGSVIGGTGIAISKACQPTRELLDHLDWLLSDETQRGFIPEQAGQPSATAAWQDAAINATSGGFYQNTFATMQDGTVRPRFDGYIAFQSAVGEVIRDGLASRRASKTIVARINALFERTQS